MIAGALLPALLLVSAAPPPAAPQPQAADAADMTELPPPRFGATAELVEALAIQEAAAHILDDFWRPAAAALVAANPDKAEAARRFADERRAAELALYAPLVTFIVDQHAVELLNPRVARRLEVLHGRMSAEIGRTRDFPESRRRAYAAESLRITSPAARRANDDLRELARLALTPDGLVLRELHQRGFVQCALLRGPPVIADQDAFCAALEDDPALRRLKRSADGRRLLDVSNYAHGHLAAMIAMGHAAGISLHRLLPPDEVRAAGLEVPPDADLSRIPSDAGGDSG